MEYWNHSVRQSTICNDILDEKAEEIRDKRDEDNVLSGKMASGRG